MPLDPYSFGSVTLCKYLPRDTKAGVLVGVWRGVDALEFLRRLPELHLTLVDNWSFRGLPEKTARRAPSMGIPELAHMALGSYSERVTWMEMASAFATFTVEMEEDESQDFVYLDGDHSCDAVLEDISRWWPKVKPGGILAGHDFGHPEFPGVADAVREHFNRFEVDGTVWMVKR